MTFNRQYLIISVAILSCLTTVSVAQSERVAFADTKAVVDTIWGVPIADNYRWLESLESDSAKEWLKRQGKLLQNERMKCFGKFTDAYMRIQKGSSVKYPQLSDDGKYLFYNMWVSEYTPPALYYKEAVDAPMKLAYNPNHDRYAKNPVSIESYILSPDKRYLALLLSVSGSDWRTIRVRDLKKERDLPEVIEWVKFSNLEWTDSGFFYARFKEPAAGETHTALNTQQQLYFHKLGEAIQQDRLMYTVVDKPNSFLHFKLVGEKRYLVISSMAKLGSSWCNTVAYKDLKQGMFSEMKMFIASPLKKEFDFDVVDYVNGQFAVRTNFDAPHYRALLYDKDSVNRRRNSFPSMKKSSSQFIISMVNFFAAPMIEESIP
jgi:prolyl oligopeptidase